MDDICEQYEKAKNIFSTNETCLLTHFWMETPYEFEYTCIVWFWIQACTV